MEAKLGLYMQERTLPGGTGSRLRYWYVGIPKYAHHLLLIFSACFIASPFSPLVVSIACERLDNKQQSGYTLIDSGDE
jgi:hypothetical protein